MQVTRKDLKDALSLLATVVDRNVGPQGRKKAVDRARRLIEEGDDVKVLELPSLSREAQVECDGWTARLLLKALDEKQALMKRVEDQLEQIGQLQAAARDAGRSAEHARKDKRAVEDALAMAQRDLARLQGYVQRMADERRGPALNLPQLESDRRVSTSDPRLTGFDRLMEEGRY